MFWWLFLIAVTLWAIVAAWRKRKLWRAAKQFPIDVPAYPVIGHAYHFMGSSEDRMNGLMLLGTETIKNGGLGTVWLGQQCFIFLADPQNAEFLLRTCLEKDQRIMRFPQQLTKSGSIFAPVSIWRPRRKFAAPAFSQKALKGFVSVFARQSGVLAAQLRTVADGSDLSIWKYYSAFTFDSICETNMGIHLNAQLKDHPFVEAFGTAATLIAHRLLQPWLHNDFVYSLMPQAKQLTSNVQYIYDFVGQIIQDKRKELAEKKNNPDYKLKENCDDAPTLLESLIEASSLSDEGKSEEIVVILGAGTDTSAVAACFATVLLSRYPDEQKKVYDELKEVFGDSDRDLTFEDLPRLKYLEAVLKEALRLYPPGPITARQVDQDVQLPSGETIVAGMSLCLHIWAMHRNPRYWGADAAEFRPARFLEGSLKHPAQFMPFSYGMRNCIGYQYAMMSLKTALSSVLRRYRVLPPAGLSAAELQAPIRVKYDVMMKDADDFVVRLQPRK